MQVNNDNSLEELTVPNNKWLTSRSGLLIVLIVAVCAAVLITHWPTLSAKAISFDDGKYFEENHLVRNPSWESAWRFLTEVLKPSTIEGYYQPLSMISLMVDYAIGGQTDSLRQFHLTSLIFHIANTTLIILLLYQLFGNAWIAAAIGLLFGVHPLTVEPIPWVGERKTLLAAFFTLWSLVFYVRYVHKGNVKSYYGCILMYLLALMSKPTSTPLPVILLLMDYWPLKRLNWRTIFEKLPLFFIGAISAVITYISQAQTASIITPQTYGLLRVPLVICHNIIFYLYKIVWPVNLSSHYAFPDPLEFSIPMVKIGVIGTCILIVLLVISLRWTRAAMTGWLIFFVMVFPTLQMFQFSDVIASDKFVYLPSLGILMALAAFLVWICRADSANRHTVRYAVLAIAVITLAGAESFGTRRYLVCWKDTISLFTNMVKVAPNATSPLNNLGVAYGDKGDIEKAMECFNQVLKLKPNDIMGHLNLGKTFAEQGKLDEAMEQYNELLRIKPDDTMAYQNIAVILVNQGRIDDAIAVYRKGLSQKPKNPTLLHMGLGTLLFQQGKLDEAIYELQIATKLTPNSSALNNFAVALALKGRIDEAIECSKQAIGVDPKNAEAHFNLASLLLSKSELKSSIAEFEKAIQINPKYTKAQINLATALMQDGQTDKAIIHASEAVKIDPNNVDAHLNLAMALEQQDKLNEAEREFRCAIKLQPEFAEAHYELGNILVKQGRLEEAAAEYQEVLKIDPQNAQAQESLQKIKAK
jgi:tetratricopeptide (TPR) repeat protein